MLAGCAGGVGDLVGVGDDGVGGVDGEGYVEGGLVGGLVEAGEGAAGVSGLELGYGVVAGLGLGEIEAAELVVEDSGVGDVEGDLTCGELVREGKGGLLFRVVEGDLRGLGTCFDGEEFDLGGVEGDGFCWGSRG